MKKNKRGVPPCHGKKQWISVIVFPVCPVLFGILFCFSCKTAPEPVELPLFHLLSPGHMSLFPDSSPHFEWSKDAEAAGDFDEKEGAGPDVKYYEIWLDSERIGSVEKGVFHFAETPELEWETTHEWYVVAVDTLNRLRKSVETFTFTVTRAPNLICPVSYGTCDPVFEFAWDAYWYADKWEIVIDDTEDFSSPVIFEETGFDLGVRDGLYNGDLFDFLPQKGVSMQRDILGDVLHYYEVDREYYPSRVTESLENWSSAGGGSLLFDEDNGIWYVSFRNRSPRDNSPGQDNSLNAGYGVELWKHTDGYLRSPWIKVWEIPAASGESLGGVSLKKFNGLYYYYFSHGPEWRIRYVVGASVEELGARLGDSSTWKTIMGGVTRDPRVMKINNFYYMIIRGDTEWDHYALFRSSSPDFSSFTKLAIDMHSPYKKRYKDDDQDPGTIVYDRKSGKYIYWGTERGGGDIYWFWTSSYDLVDWKLDGRERVFRWFKQTTTARFQSVVENEDKVVILMEWDDDMDFGQGVFVWEYFKYPVPARTYMVKDPLPNGRYWWKVRGYAGDEPCPFSVTGTFYIQ